MRTLTRPLNWPAGRIGPGAAGAGFHGDIPTVLSYATAVNDARAGDGETTDGRGVRLAVAGIVAYSVAAPVVSFARYLSFPTARSTPRPSR